MSHHIFKKAINCQNQVSNFYHLQIKQQQKLLKTIKQILPESLAEHVLHCVISDKTLLIYTDSASWSSQLRFYKTTILQNFIGSQFNVELLQIRLIPKMTNVKPQKKLPLPSKENIELIRYHARQVTDDKLQQALLKLSQTLDKLSDDN